MLACMHGLLCDDSRMPLRKWRVMRSLRSSSGGVVGIAAFSCDMHWDAWVRSQLIILNACMPYSREHTLGRATAEHRHADLRSKPRARAL